MRALGMGSVRGLMAVCVVASAGAALAQDMGFDFDPAAFEPRQGALVLPGRQSATAFVDLPSNVSALRVRVSSDRPVTLHLHDRSPPDPVNPLAGAIRSSAPLVTGEVSLVRDGGGELRGGRWAVTVSNPGAQSARATFWIERDLAGEAFRAGPGLAGTWADPAFAAQGIYLQFLSADSAYVAWSTYDEDGRQQAYLYGVGRVEGDRIDVPNVYQTIGGRFGAAFRPAGLVTQAIGAVRLQFEDCATMSVGFSSRFMEGPMVVLRARRSSGIAGLGCDATGAAPFEGGPDPISGVWFDPARPGEGWLVQRIDANRALIYWYTFDPWARQAWLGGIAERSGDRWSVDVATLPNGGRFAARYAPEAISVAPWGRMALTLSGCGEARFNAQGPAYWGAYDSPRIVRLAAIAGVPSCGR